MRSNDPPNNNGHNQLPYDRLYSGLIQGPLHLTGPNKIRERRSDTMEPVGNKRGTAHHDMIDLPTSSSGRTALLHVNVSNTRSIDGTIPFIRRGVTGRNSSPNK